jgi:hypothetical protein
VSRTPGCPLEIVASIDPIYAEFVATRLHSISAAFVATRASIAGRAATR